MNRSILEKNSRVLVTGATGAIGPRVVNALHQAGYRVRALSLDAPEPQMFPSDVEVVTEDILHRSALESAMQEVDAVVHMAALLHIVNPPPGLSAKYERINVGGTAQVVDCAIKAGVRRVVLFSTIAVYGNAGGQMLNEQSPTHPETFYARTKLSAERIVLSSKGGNGLPVGTVLRLGAVYGSRIKGNYERLTRALARNRFIPVGSGLNRRSLVYDRDVGRAAALTISHPDAAGCVFNVTDGGFHSLNEIIESICGALGRKPPRLSLPADALRIAAGISEMLAGILSRKSPITREMIDKYTEDIAVDGSLIQKKLGFAPQYDLQAGWHETICEMRQMKHL